MASTMWSENSLSYPLPKSVFSIELWRWQVLDISGSTSLHIVLIFAYCCLYRESPCLSASFTMKYQRQLEFCPCHTVDLIWWQLVVQEPDKQPCAALAFWACLGATQMPSWQVPGGGTALETWLSTIMGTSESANSLSCDLPEQIWSQLTYSFQTWDLHSHMCDWKL